MHAALAACAGEPRAPRLYYGTDDHSQGRRPPGSGRRFHRVARAQDHPDVSLETGELVLGTFKKLNYRPFGRGYETVLEGYYQLYRTARQDDPSGLAEAAHGLRDQARRVAEARVGNFFRGMPRTLREMAAFVEEGRSPQKQTGS